VGAEGRDEGGAGVVMDGMVREREGKGREERG
jgi:hypothetical protein